MTIRDPKISRVHVTVYDRRGGKSRTLTVYGATLDQTFKRIRDSIGQKRDQRPVAASTTE